MLAKHTACQAKQRCACATEDVAHAIVSSDHCMQHCSLHHDPCTHACTKQTSRVTAEAAKPSNLNLSVLKSVCTVSLLFCHQLSCLTVHTTPFSPWTCPPTGGGPRRGRLLPGKRTDRDADFLCVVAHWRCEEGEGCAVLELLNV